MVEKVKTFASRPDLVQILLPKEGVSMISTKGAPFHDSTAEFELFRTIESGLGGFCSIQRHEDPINGESFAKDAARNLVTLMGLERPRKGDAMGGK